MNYEEQILELKKRIEVLEKEEYKRKTKKNIKLFLEIGKYLFIIILLFVGYFNYIKPIMDKIDYVEDKIDGVENFIDEKLDSISKFNPFS